MHSLDPVANDFTYHESDGIVGQALELRRWTQSAARISVVFAEHWSMPIDSML